MEQWFEYDWQFDGEDAVFGVDTHFFDICDFTGAYLVKMICSSRKELMTNSESARYHALMARLMKKTSAAYVGFVETASKINFYMYTSNSDLLRRLEDLTKSKAHVSFDMQIDNERDVYRNLLYPSRAKSQTEENRQMLLQYKKVHDNLAMPRKINFHMCFPAEQLRLLFEDEIRLSGYAIGDTELNGDSDMPHGTAVHKISSLKKREIDEHTTKLITTAQKFNGDMLYWDAPKIPLRR